MSGSRSLLVSQIHSGVGAAFGSTVTVLTPIEDWLSRLALGTATGILVWATTRLASFFVTKYKGKP